MRIILLIPVETRLSQEQTDKPNQVCKRHVRIYLHGLCVGPIQTDIQCMQTLRFLMQQFACSPEVLAPEKKIILHHYRAALCEQNHHKQQILFIHPSITCSPPQQG